jgi:hypothetical protein
MARKSRIDDPEVRWSVKSFLGWFRFNGLKMFTEQLENDIPVKLTIH